MMRIRTAGKALIIRNRRILTTVNRDEEGLFYLLPGGGQEPGESLHDCVRREVREEIGAEMDVGELRFVRDYVGRNHHRAELERDVHLVDLIFECRLLTEPVDRGELPDATQVGIEWLPIERIDEYLLIPRGLRPHLRAWGKEPVPVYIGDVN